MSAPAQVRPSDDQRASPGERLVVKQTEPGDPIEIIDEVTLPERVHLVNAARRTPRSEVLLTLADARWLYAVLGDLLNQPIEGLSTLALIARRDYVLSQIDEHRLSVQPSEGELIVHRALLLCCGEIERALAISNARATSAADRAAPSIDPETRARWRGWCDVAGPVGAEQALEMRQAILELLEKRGAESMAGEAQP